MTVRPGGYLIFAIRDEMMETITDEGKDYGAELQRMVESGLMTHEYTEKYFHEGRTDLGPDDKPASLKIYRKTDPEKVKQETQAAL